MVFPFKGVIFDFDCTLANSKRGMAACVNEVLSQMGYPTVDFITAVEAIGHPPQEKFTMLTGSHDALERLRFKKLYLAIIAPPVSYLLNHVVLFPGVIELLQFLNTQHCKIGIVSNKTREALLAEITHLGILDEIDIIVSLDDVVHAKPHPNGIHAVLSAWKMSHADVLYIGDHVIDAKTADAAAVQFVGVTTGSTTRDALISYPHLCIVESMCDVLQWFRSAVATKILR
jgi:phosphoglycolate phosphatase